MIIFKTNLILLSIKIIFLKVHLIIAHKNIIIIIDKKSICRNYLIINLYTPINETPPEKRQVKTKTIYIILVEARSEY